MKVIITIIFILVSFSVVLAGEKGRKGKTIYKYKKFERFDFEDMLISGESGSPGDLSVIPRSQGSFKNRLPYKKNFNYEIRKATERIR